MAVIFLVVESEIDYDSAHVRNVKAFTNYIDAETLRFNLQTTQERKNEVQHKVRAEYIAWEKENPSPQAPVLGVSLPKWKPKWGSKKNADPEILATFQAEEERVRAIARQHAEEFSVVYNEWEQRAVAVTRQMLVKAGLTQEEADTVECIGRYLSQTDYDYEVEEVELA